MFWSRRRKPVSTDSTGPDIPKVKIRALVGSYTFTKGEVRMSLEVGDSWLSCNVSPAVQKMFPAGEEVYLVMAKKD